MLAVLGSLLVLFGYILSVLFIVEGIMRVGAYLRNRRELRRDRKEMEMKRHKEMLKSIHMKTLRRRQGGVK